VGRAAGRRGRGAGPSPPCSPPCARRGAPARSAGCGRRARGRIPPPMPLAHGRRGKPAQDGPGETPAQRARSLADLPQAETQAAGPRAVWITGWWRGNHGQGAHRWPPPTACRCRGTGSASTAAAPAALSYAPGVYGLPHDDRPRVGRAGVLAASRHPARPDHLRGTGAAAADPLGAHPRGAVRGREGDRGEVHPDPRCRGPGAGRAGPSTRIVSARIRHVRTASQMDQHPRVA